MWFSDKLNDFKFMCFLHLFQITKARFHFENIAFRRSVNNAIKQKIELISSLSETTGFTCFDWFLLDSYTALEISLEFVSWLFLLITVRAIY